MGRKALGTGLDLLLPTATSDVEDGDEGSRVVAISAITLNPYQPRQTFLEDKIEELSLSIKEHGVLQPLWVRAKSEGGYELIAGERRLQAAQKAGLSEVPVIIKDIDDDTSAVFAMIENIQREDLNPLEQALGMQRLIDTFSYSQDQLAQLLGKSRSVVSNTLRLLQLHKDVQSLLRNKSIEMGHARCLITLADEEQVILAQQTEAEGLSVRQLEQLIKNTRSPKAPKEKNLKKSAQSSQKWHNLEQSLSQDLSSKVVIHEKDNEILCTIRFADIDKLQAFAKGISFK